MIKLSNVVKEYDSRAGKDGDLKNINLTLPDTGFVFLLGTIGCGKYTLLNVLSGLEMVTTGDIEVNGESLKNLSPKALADYRNRNIGVLFKEHNLIDDFSVYENVAISLSLRDKKAVAVKVTEALAFVGLEGYEKRKISELSGGEKQKVAIARTIVADRQILFADELAWNLDSASSQEIFDILKKLSKKILVFTVTRDTEKAKQYGDRVITMADGVIASDELLTETPQENNELLYGKNKQEKTKNLNFIRLAKLSFINIWKKKWWALLATMLIFLTLTMSGIAISTFRFDGVNTLLEACYDNDLYEFRFRTTTTDYRQYGIECFTPKKIDKIQKNVPNHKLDLLYTIQPDRGLDIEGLSQYNFIGRYFAIMDNDTLQRYGYNLSYGKLPTNTDEICLSKFVAKKIFEGNLIEGVTDYESLSKVKIKIKMYPDLYFKVVGIVDTKIDDLCNKPDINKNLQVHAYKQELVGSYSSAIMVSKDFMQDIYLSDGFSCLSTYFYDLFDGNIITEQIKSIKKPLYSEGYAKLATKQNGVYGEIFYKQGKSSLSGNEIIAPFKVVSEIAKRYSEKPIISNDEILSFLNSEKPSITNQEILEFLNSEKPANSYYLRMRNVQVDYNKNSKLENFQIVGFYTDSSREEIIVSNDFLSNKKLEPFVDGVIIRLTGDRSIDYKFVEYFLYGDGRNEVSITGIVALDIEYNAYLHVLYKNISLYTAIVAGVFSVAMMVYFIVTSIKNNKKQIGVFTALGMHSTGVIYIYILEVMIFALLSFILAVGGVYILSSIFGFSRGCFSLIQLIPITAVEIFAMLGVSIAICVISSIIPIVKKSRVKPVDLIKDLK